MLTNDAGLPPNLTSPVDHTAAIVAAFVSRNAVTMNDLPALIVNVHKAVQGLAGAAPSPEAEKKLPAVPIKKSITPDFIVCLEDGQKFKSLKRHLKTHYNLTPEQYREKWGLPADYPMVAPSYSETRSRLAKDNGLGKKSR